MKIIHCLTTLNFGGIERIVPASLPILKQMYPDLEHVLCVLQSGENREQVAKAFEVAQIPLYILDKRGKIDFKFCRNFKKLIGDEKPDIIHAYDSTSMFWARYFFGRDNRIRIICHCGGISEVTVYRRRLKEWFLCDRADYFVFVSKSTKEIWNSYLNIKCPQGVVYNGIDLNSFRPRGAGKEFVETGFPAPFILLMVGRIVPQKAIHVVFYALSILKERGQTDIILYLVGDGRSTGELKELANFLGISFMVKFEGFKADVQPYYERSHVAICTSYNETFSLFLAEAMFNRLVSISANVGGPSEFIENAVNGFVLPPVQKPSLRNYYRGTKRVYNGHFGKLMPPLEVKPEVLAECIMDVRNRYIELTQLRDCAQKTIRKNFDITNYCIRLRKVYYDVIKKNKEIV